MRKGMFITFEGVDGSGKSTQARLLVEWLRARGLETILVREPGGTPLGEKIRELLLSHKYIPNERAEVLLYMASRAQLTEKIVIPALERKAIVVADRYADSSLVYQGIARKLGAEIVQKLNLFATYGIEPDITFLIDVPIYTALERLNSKKKDRLENEGIDFLERVAIAYKKLANEEPERFRIIDGCHTVEEIHQEIKAIVESALKSHGILREE